VALGGGGVVHSGQGATTVCDWGGGGVGSVGPFANALSENATDRDRTATDFFSVVMVFLDASFHIKEYNF
jgi:hypothetical protein